MFGHQLFLERYLKRMNQEKENDRWNQKKQRFGQEEGTDQDQLYPEIHWVAGKAKRAAHYELAWLVTRAHRGARFTESGESGEACNKANQQKEYADESSRWNTDWSRRQNRRQKAAQKQEEQRENGWRDQRGIGTHIRRKEQRIRRFKEFRNDSRVSVNWPRVGAARTRSTYAKTAYAKDGHLPGGACRTFDWATLKCPEGTDESSPAL
jgi:hypothetical protein